MRKGKGIGVEHDICAAVVDPIESNIEQSIVDLACALGAVLSSYTCLDRGVVGIFSEDDEEIGHGE